MYDPRSTTQNRRSAVHLLSIYLRNDAVGYITECAYCAELVRVAVRSDCTSAISTRMLHRYLRLVSVCATGSTPPFVACVIGEIDIVVTACCRM